MRPFLVVNPKSANGQTGKRWAELSASVSRGVGEFHHAFTEKSLDAIALARRALNDGYDCIVAVGGDGTINEVVNGFFENDRAVNPEACFAVLPRGTGGDFRRSFGWELDIDAAAKRIASGQWAHTDVGRLEFALPEGGTGVRYFANICSFGVSGEVDAEVAKGGKGFGGKLAFMMASAKALMKYSDRKVRIRVDGGAPEELDITTVAIANGRYFGGGMMVAPTAKTDDGIFDVTIWSGYGLSDFVFKSSSIYDGSHTQLKGTRTLRCTSLSAESDDRVLLDVDGEQPGTLPCRISMLPKALKVRI